MGYTKSALKKHQNDHGSGIQETQTIQEMKHWRLKHFNDWARSQNMSHSASQGAQSENTLKSLCLKKYIYF